ncbi:MAG: tetratricopeptide repeat protein [Rhodocyclaceae bacterium]|nr:tetratricopeptide repeat protein [Rhodocyclaceae bacterium]
MIPTFSTFFTAPAGARRLCAIVALAACSAWTPAVHAADDDDTEAAVADTPVAGDRLPRQELTARIVYQLLLAEIAARRGKFEVAVPAYLDLAKSTRDPRIARRATEFALYARQRDMALEAARLWAELDPQSPQAQRTLAGLAAHGSNPAEVEPQIAKLLAEQGAKTGAALLQLNRFLANMPDAATAADMVRRLTEPYVKLPEAHFARAQAAMRAGKPDVALGDLDRALERKPDWEPAVIYKAQIQQPADAEKAVATLKAYLAKHPKARDVRMQYARALVGARRMDEARREFQRVLNESPDRRDAMYAVGVLAYQVKDYTTAEPLFRKLVDAGVPEADTLRVYLGQIAEESKRTDEALGWYDSVKSGDQYVQAQTRAATLLARSDKVEAGLARLQALRGQPGTSEVQLTLTEAFILREAGRAQDAFDLLQQALLAKPDEPDMLYELGLLAERVERMDVMEQSLRKVIAIKPDFAHGYNALGYSFADRNINLPEAQSLIEKALQLAPDDPAILDSMGWVMYRNGNLAGALQHLTRAFSLTADPEIAAHLGEVLWMMGRRSDATRTWQEAAKAHPGSAPLDKVMKRFLQ